jgi:hypothetical protein
MKTFLDDEQNFQNTGHRTASPGPSPSAPPSGGKTFNAAKWAAANPGKDVNAAIAKAKSQGYQVKQ